MQGAKGNARPTAGRAVPQRDLSTHQAEGLSVRGCFGFGAYWRIFIHSATNVRRDTMHRILGAVAVVVLASVPALAASDVMAGVCATQPAFSPPAPPHATHSTPPNH